MNTGTFRRTAGLTMAMLILACGLFPLAQAQERMGAPAGIADDSPKEQAGTNAPLPPAPGREPVENTSAATPAEPSKAVRARSLKQERLQREEPGVGIGGLNREAPSPAN